MELTELINHPERLDRETLYELRSMLALYPYFQTARLLMLQNLLLVSEGLATLRNLPLALEPSLLTLRNLLTLQNLLTLRSLLLVLEVRVILQSLLMLPSLDLVSEVLRAMLQNQEKLPSLKKPPNPCLLFLISAPMVHFSIMHN